MGLGRSIVESARKLGGCDGVLKGRFEIRALGLDPRLGDVRKIR